ncbi:MAG: glycosyltransferase family 2 protein [Deltaproteobacteria bacterium]|nr:glycosyltransferase family 2 protein [Deltaproteobacteria bacterium]
MPFPRYVIITPARNEAGTLEATIRSVVAQSLRPSEWAIVSDGSTDDTDEIARRWSRLHPFIRLVRREGGRTRDFGSKAVAFKAGLDSITSKYDFIGNLDADITFGPDYYRDLLKAFSDERLGLAGGVIYELIGREFVPQKNFPESVAGAIQLFRRECFVDIGGYIPISAGGIDAAAEISARMRGWRVRAFDDLKAFHHRRVSGGNGRVLKSRFRHGVAHYLLGYHPLFEIMKCAYRVQDRPYVLGALCTLAGYAWSAAIGCERPVSGEFVEFIRNEQRERLRSFRLFKAVMRPS